MYVCVINTELFQLLFSLFTVVQCASVWWEGWCGTQSCGGQFHQSISRPRVCPQDPPQPPPTGMNCSINPDFNEMLQFLSLGLSISSLFRAQFVSWHLIKILYTSAPLGRRSPRVRHGIRKPRPSSAELTNDLKDMSEGEDVFYTYRASVSSSKDSEGDASPHQLVSVTAEVESLLAWHTTACHVRTESSIIFISEMDPMQLYECFTNIYEVKVVISDCLNKCDSCCQQIYQNVAN